MTSVGVTGEISNDRTPKSKTVGASQVTHDPISSFPADVVVAFEELT